jgi:hypothetical protein
MEILSQEQEQNQVQEPIAEQCAEMERSQDNFYWSKMWKHLPEQIRGPVPNKKQREQVIRHLRGKRSLEIQHYLNAMRDWIGEREMRTENRRFQWFASIALSCLATSHLRRQPLSDTEQLVPAQVCKVVLEEPPWLLSESTFPLSSVFSTPRAPPGLSIQTIHPLLPTSPFLDLVVDLLPLEVVDRSITFCVPTIRTEIHVSAEVSVRMSVNTQLGLRRCVGLLIGQDGRIGNRFNQPRAKDGVGILKIMF